MLAKIYDTHGKRVSITRQDQLVVVVVNADVLCLPFYTFVFYTLFHSISFISIYIFFFKTNQAEREREREDRQKLDKLENSLFFGWKTTNI